MRQGTETHKAGLFAPLALAAVAALVLYWGGRDRPFWAPDLEVVSPGSDAKVRLPWDQVWRAPIPATRPELATYRPLHGLLLRLQYSMWPGNAEGFHRLNLVLFLAWIGAGAVLSAAIIGRTSPGARWGIAVAALLLAVHPMASEAVQSLATQNVLVAGLCWTLALLAYHLMLTRRLKVAIGAGLISVLFFVAFGSHEAALLIPLSLLAMEALRPRETVEPSPAEHNLQFARTVSVALPLALVSALLIALRWKALSGQLGAWPEVRSLGDMGAVQRVLAGPSLMTMGVLRLIAPWKPTLFYTPRYEPSVVWPFWVGIPLMVAAASLVLYLNRRNTRLALALLLALIPLLGLIQLVPRANAFSEGFLFFALPGAAIFAGELLRIAERKSGWALVVAGLFLAGCSGITFHRNLQWGDAGGLWQAESLRHPSNPWPATDQLIGLIANSQGLPDLSSIEAVSKRALELAKPPDADPVYQYLAVLYMTRGDLKSLLAVAKKGGDAPGPHLPGYYAALGGAVKKLGDNLGISATEEGNSKTEVAEGLFLKELEANPDNFDALYALSEINLRNQRDKESFDLAMRANKLAPSHMKARTLLIIGKAAARLKQPKTAYEALDAAVRLDPDLVEAYTALARHFLDQKEYVMVERVLTAARDRTKLRTFSELFQIQVQSLERQNRKVDAYDFLREMTILYPWDLPLHVYAGSYLIDHGQFDTASEMYNRMIKQSPGNPDALVGLGLVALKRDKNPEAAQQMWLMAVRNSPGHPEAIRLLKLLDSMRKPAEGGKSQSPEPSPQAQP